MPPMDEARRARLQAKLDAETLKGTLANKVRASPMTRRRPTPAVIRPRTKFGTSQSVLLR